MRALVCALCLGLAGCGLKGDLYLPPEPLDSESPPASETDSATTSPSAGGEAVPPSPVSPGEEQRAERDADGAAGDENDGP